jgi:hypothetical protein
VFELVLKWKCVLLTGSDSWVPSQQNTNTWEWPSQFMHVTELPVQTVGFRASRTRTRCSLAHSTWPGPVRRLWNLPSSTQMKYTKHIKLVLNCKVLKCCIVFFMRYIEEQAVLTSRSSALQNFFGTNFYNEMHSLDLAGHIRTWSRSSEMLSEQKRTRENENRNKRTQRRPVSSP